MKTKVSAHQEIREAMRGLRQAYVIASTEDRKQIVKAMDDIKKASNQLKAAEEDVTVMVEPPCTVTVDPGSADVETEEMEDEDMEDEGEDDFSGDEMNEEDGEDDEYGEDMDEEEELAISGLMLAASALRELTAAEGDEEPAAEDEVPIEDAIADAGGEEGEEADDSIADDEEVMEEDDGGEVTESEDIDLGEPSEPELLSEADIAELQEAGLLGDDAEAEVDVDVEEIPAIMAPAPTSASVARNHLRRKEARDAIRARIKARSAKPVAKAPVAKTQASNKEALRTELKAALSLLDKALGKKTAPSKKN